MPPSASDKALRRLVAELATTTPEDVAAVLAMLDARTSAQVRALLVAYAGIGDAAEPEIDTAAVDTSGLSGWLAARTLGKPLAGPDAYHVTPAVTDTLRTCAASLPRRSLSAQSPSKAAAGRDGLGLMLRPFSGKRADA